MMKNGLILLALLVMLAACSSGEETGRLEFRDAWVRQMPLGSKMTAGFGHWVNTGSGDLEITVLSSPDFKNISLHRTLTKDGISRMEAVPEVVISDGAGLVLEPGGYHLMLMGPVVEIGESVELNVLLSNGLSFSYELPVERR